MTYTIPTVQEPIAGPSSYSSPSPIRSSPLSNPPLYASTRTPSPSLAQARPRPIPRQSRIVSAPQQRIAQSPSSPPSYQTPTRVSTSIGTPSPPLSRSHPLLGSYPLSLLHSRMSHANQPHNQPFDSQQGFTLHIGALGKGKSCPPALRGPEHISVPFSATYYDLEDSGKSTPWVGNVDLESYYFRAYGDPLTPTSGKGKGRAPDFPGYRVAPVGQLQLLVKTPTKAVKVFLIPYDLRQLPIGGRLLARERTYVSTANSARPVGSTSPARSAETLRYAVQLQFVCLPGASRDSKSSLAGSDNSLAYYVSKTLKVVFTSCPPESHEEIRIERYDEIVPASDGPLGRSYTLGFSPASSFSPSMHKAEEWEDIRSRWEKLHCVDSPAPEDRLTAPSARRLERTEGFNPATERAVSPIPSRPASPIFARRKIRRGSLEERELSDKLRGMAVGE